MPWSKRISPGIGVDQLRIDAARVRLERLVGGVDAHLDARQRARHARRARAAARPCSASSAIASISSST